MSGNTTLIPDADDSIFEFSDVESDTACGTDTVTISAVDSAVIPQPELETQVSVCPSCRSAENWHGLSYCPSCGYYPKANSAIDVSGPDEEVVYENFWEAIPEWGWAMGSMILAITVLNVFCLLLIPDPLIRGLITISEMVLGFCSFCYFHWKAYMKSLTFSDDIGVVNLVLKPIDVWRPTFLELPATGNQVSRAGASIALLVLAPVICGGYDFFAFLEAMAPKNRPKQSLVAAVANAGSKMDKDKKKLMSGSLMQGVAVEETGNSDASMEEAMDEFTGQAVGDKKKDGETGKKSEDEGDKDIDDETLTADEEAAPELTPEQLRPKLADCVIIGFRLTPGNDLESIVLASDVNYSLHYVGVVSANEMSSVEKQIIKNEIPRLYRRSKPVQTSVEAHWLNPELVCKVRFKKWTNSKKLVDPIFEELLDVQGKN